jgi:outer membrane protein assembly factor BamB
MTWISVLLLGTAAEAQFPKIEWWYDLDAPSFGSAATADIDFDGKLEIVFGTYFNDERIVCLNAEDGSLHWEYGTGGCNDASPVIADVDQDGMLEVVVPASSPCKVYCFDGKTGAVEWDASTGSNCIDSPPAVGDVDNDGKPEVVLGAFNGYVYCLNGEDGSEEWKVNVGTGSYIQSCPNLVDLDGDEDLDVVVAQWSGDCRVFGLRGHDGSEIWHSDTPTDWMYHGGSVADLDGDGKPEIAIGCYDSKVYVLNGEDGSLHWQYPTVFYVGAPTSMADLDNDGHLEIVYHAYNRVGVLSHTGGSQWSWTAGGSNFRGSAVADMDSDGVLDLVFGSDDGKIQGLRGSDGHLNWQLNLQAHYGKTLELDHAPVIADFDKDGILDVFIVGGYGESTNPSSNHGRAYMVSVGTGIGPGWTLFRNDIRHSACHGGFATLETDKDTLPAGTGGEIRFDIKACTVNPNRNYLVLGGVTGTVPGTVLPKGLATLPLNWDVFTDLVLGLLNTPVFDAFTGKLDGQGHAEAVLKTGPIPGGAGVTIHFACCLGSPFDFASNPVAIKIVP